MTLASEVVKVSYSGDGATVAFAITFAFWDQADIRAVLRSAAGVETVWVLGTDYTLSGGSGSTGTLTATTAPASGTTLVIKSNRANTQGTAFPLGGPFPSTNAERAIDQTVRLVQQGVEELSRAVKFSETSPDSDVTFPDVTGNGSKLIRVNAAGTALEAATLASLDSSALTIPVTVAQGGTNATTAATARDNLGAAGDDDVNVFTKRQSWAKGADIASANALTLGTDGNYFDITGTTSITSIGTVGVGTVVKLHFDGALTLTHHATDLILPGAANITTAAGDEAEFVEYATGDWRCTSYVRAATAPLVFATAAQMETGTATNVAVTPGVQHRGPGVAKAWAAVTVSGGTPSLAAGYNVSSTITDNAAGDFTINFTTPFSDANYVVMGSAEAASSASTGLRGVSIRNGGRATGSCRVYVGTNAGLEDINFTVAFFGDQ